MRNHSDEGFRSLHRAAMIQLLSTAASGERRPSHAIAAPPGGLSHRDTFSATGRLPSRMTFAQARAP